MKDIVMENKKDYLKNYLLFIIATVLLTVVDRVTKYLAVIKLKDNQPFVLIKDVFELHYLENRGAAFGMLQGKRVFFIILTVIFVLALVYLYGRIPFTKKFKVLHILSAFLLAGALGNFIDRVRFNYVIDFFYFSLIDFPIFNVADIYVTVSVFILIFLIIFYYKDEDLKEIKIIGKED